MPERAPTIAGYDPYADAGECVYDAAAADKATRFFPACLIHVSGELAGKPFALQTWESAVVKNLFGWRRPDATRRYREALVYVPRKNGKTTLLAGLGCYVFLCDNEAGAQIYAAAAERDQAAILWRIARNMLAHHPRIWAKVKEYSSSRSLILKADPMSCFKPLSSEAYSKHGMDAHAAFLDELHTQPDRLLYDVLKTSMGSRRQPLFVSITTADFAGESLCNEMVNRARQVRDGTASNRYFLPVLYEALPQDDWRSPDVWAKANPNLGVSVKRDYLAELCEKAKAEPSFENTFRRLHLNQVTEQEKRWLSMAAWDACPPLPPLAELAGQVCYAGLDLASTLDLCAFVLYFPASGAVLPWFWAPTAQLDKRVDYREWHALKLLEVTPGNVTDYAYIRRKVNELAKQFPGLAGIGYDPWNARQLAVELSQQDGLPLVEYRQGYVSMNEPAKAFEAAMLKGALRHGGHALLRWQASGVAIQEDAAGNIKPVKPARNSLQRIDGIVASIMAMGLSLANGGAGSASVYQDRGLVTL